MRIPRYRWLLPVGQLLIVSLVLLLSIGQSSAVLRNEKRSSSSSAIVIVSFSPQDDSSLGWNPRHVDYAPPDDLIFLSFGNLPAGIIAATAKPAPNVHTKTKLWDPIWFLILESLSFPIWFLIGGWLDSGSLKLKKTMLTYLAARFGFAVFVPLSGVARLGAVLELLFWLGLGVYPIVLGLRRWASGHPAVVSWQNRGGPTGI